MEVYILLGHVDYEGYDILGVYSTKELAQKEFDLKNNTESRPRYDRYSITTRKVIEK